MKRTHYLYMFRAAEEEVKATFFQLYKQPIVITSTLYSGIRSMAGNTRALSALVTRSVEGGSNTSNGNSIDDCNSDDNTRKKMRVPKAVDPTPLASPTFIGDDFGAKELREEEDDQLQSPCQWWFSRHSSPCCAGKVAAAQFTELQRESENSSSMVLSEHLGLASDVVESLTHDVHNWSLTRLPNTAAAKNNGRSSSAKSDRKKEKQKRCKDAQRQVRMARRQCLEERKRQQQHIHGASSTHSTMD